MHSKDQEMEGVRSPRIFQVTYIDTRETGGRSEDGESKNSVVVAKTDFVDQTTDEIRI